MVKAMNNQSAEVIEQWRAEHKRLLLDTNEWCTANFHVHKETGEYYDWKLEAMWQGFLLSRQTVCIELPEPLEFDDGHDEPSRHYWPTQIKNAIKSQGYQVRVKGE